MAYLLVTVEQKSRHAITLLELPRRVCLHDPSYGMARQDDEDDDTSLLDDSFEDLPIEALNALERDAVRATQPTKAPVNRPDTQDFHHTLPTLPWPNPNDTSRAGKPPKNSSSDYGDANEAELVDGVDFGDTVRQDLTTAEAKIASEVTQREQWRLRRYGQHDVQHSAAGPAKYDFSEDQKLPDQVEPLPTTAIARHAPADAEQTATAPSDAAMEGLRAQLQQMLRERDALQQSLEAANSTALTKTGEISIVRANQAKAIKEYERQITTIQHLHANEAAQQKAELERALTEKERVATENKFLKRDLTEEGERVRSLKRSMKEGESPANKAVLTRGGFSAGLATTPRKEKGLPYRDGFDDHDIVPSPTRSTPRSKAGTPKGASKRKRKAIDDSPIPVLPLSQPRNESFAEAETDAQESAGDAVVLHRTGDDGRFQSLQAILNHKPDANQARTFEAFAGFALPSAPKTPFSSVILDHLTHLAAQKTSYNISSEFGQVLLSLWEACWRENYHPPINLIVDLLTFILIHNTSSIAPLLMDDIVPLLQRTIDINAIPRFQRKPESKVNALIDVGASMSLLHVVGIGCAQDDNEIEHFWRLIRYDIVLMVLTMGQPVDQIRTMIDLLHSSILHRTFGPIVGDESLSQRDNEHHVLDRLCELLGDVPHPFEGDPAPAPVDVAHLRAEVLDLLGAISNSKHGGEAMAAHPKVFGTLVKTMNDELEALYSHRADHSHSAAHVNSSTRTLYGLSMHYGAQMDLHRKLAAIPGGTHKHLVTLTRLAFSEGLVLEAGIDDDVVDYARHLLEDCVTPEEGEALLGAFAAPR
ncbi:MAG: hypothetical protein M1838_005205 [Thelocarpon superellum]|nr:MAG: hypothetical protein M1838_005205 [Thelocarpon superellum]